MRRLGAMKHNGRTQANASRATIHTECENTPTNLCAEWHCCAAAMAEQTDDSMSDLITRVRSPGGTTAAALDSLDAQNVRAIFSAALTAARDRAGQLADEAGN